MRCKTCGEETFSKKELKDIYNPMTKEEEKEVIRICGKNYDYWDIPPAIRNRGSIKAPSILKPR